MPFRSHRCEARTGDLSPFQGATLNRIVPGLKPWAEGYNPFRAGPRSAVTVTEMFHVYFCFPPGLREMVAALKRRRLMRRERLSISTTQKAEKRAK
jgi:hypothetical protein